MKQGVVQGARFLILAWLLPVVLSYVVYFGYSPNLSGEVFSEAGFAAKYDHGIYKYRVLGVGLLRITCQAIDAAALPTSAPKILQKADPTFTKEFYSAFFYMNTLLLCLTTSVLVVIVSCLGAGSASPVADLVIVVLLGMMVLAQYVVVPYDMLSYLFLAVAMHLVFRGPAGPFGVVLLSAVVVLATLTRETAAIILAIYAAVHFDSLVRPSRASSGRVSPRTVLGVLTLCFLAVYVALRVWLGTEHALFGSVRIRQNVSETFSMVGGLFFVGTLALALFQDRARRTTALFILASAPYWVAMFLIANPREIRLWVPVLIPLLLIQFRGDGPRSGEHAGPMDA